MSERMWMVRSGSRGELFEDFQKNKIIAIGWDEVGDLTNVRQSDVKNLVKNAFPAFKYGKIRSSAGQLCRFRYEFKVGDLVTTYNPETRKYLVGEIKGDYEYKPERKEYRHVRAVNWRGEALRDQLSVNARNTLGAILSLFDTGPEASLEILQALEGKALARVEPAEEVESELDTLKEDTIGKSREFIKDKVTQLTWEDAQDLVAGILRAMGYKTRVSPKGPDMGKDIIASKDGLGIEEPEIRVEVKHREGPIGAQVISSFTGHLRPGQKGIFVSTGGFTKDAKHEGERAPIPATLVDLEYLVDLIIQNYDNFDSEAREILLLRKIYWPE